MHAAKRAVEDDIHHLAPFGVAHLADRLFAAQRGIVDQDVDAAEALERGFGQRGSRLFIGDVADDATALPPAASISRTTLVGFGLVGAHIDHDRGARFRESAARWRGRYCARRR